MDLLLWTENGPHPNNGMKACIFLVTAVKKIIRKTFWEAVNGLPYTHHPDPHMEHCFDALRQSVQCKLIRRSTLSGTRRQEIVRCTNAGTGMRCVIGLQRTPRVTEIRSMMWH